MPADLTARRCRVLALAVVALATLAPLGAAAAPPAQAETTSSAKTVTAKEYDPDAADSPFPDLKVSISQTEGLIQQGIKLNWTGAKKSQVPNQQTGGENFLQVAQCWGDEPGSNGTRPDRTTCQYGGLNLPGATRYSNRGREAEVAAEDASHTAVSSSFFDPTMTAIPFTSATGTLIASVVDGKRVPDAPDLDSNEFFTKYTTNEVTWAGSGADGSGSVSFELQTVQQAPGLGCGTPVTSGDTVTGTSCWLVVIPRGITDASGVGNIQSGLFWETWKHHLAVKLGFKPTGVHCAIGAAERQLSGSELIAGAVGQWQPKLCNQANGAVYSLLTGPESDAALAANGSTTAPLAITSRALSIADVTDNLRYAPVALSGVSIAFAIDRQARATGGAVPDEVQARERQAFTSLKLTPRLLAKLLTASYTDALPQGADTSYLSGQRNITRDPDFLAINDPEWSYMSITSVGLSDALTPLGRSDAAMAIWTYILADTEAKKFLAGTADPWGMKVNPNYATKASLNPTGVGLSLPRDDFPKADPIEYEGTAANDHADVVNLVTWRPFTSSLDMGGYLVLRGDALKLGIWDTNSTPAKFTKGDRAVVGLQAVIGLTDTASAAKYQVVEASLRNPAGRYVAPTIAGLAAAVPAMTKDADQGQVVGFDPASAAAKNAAAAYPLTMPVYAAVNPAMDGAAVRADYAAFITSAVTTGQTAGTGDGQLPAGYAPLPAAWKKQALASAAVIKAGGVTTTPPTAPASTATGTSTSSGTVGTSTPGSTGSDPASSGDPAGSLTGSNTPADPAVGVFAAVVPTGAALGLVAALGAPLLSRFRRRQT
ncbi:MAG TPA: hypothetical protein VGK18_12415 [Propionicimonas sp.]|jgi:hypothetical protein|uniref:hypothetical protein n=1 Tax=Propionicimonas sp. TaxID=1955623 RepID=UPI002F4227F4